jgi:hypothetical protein|tara:strand:+ start:3435 stop:3704 length:270 start_codon:yes stop_codon:yes gene_type:complete
MYEILTYYAAFALSGGIACTWALHRPSMYIVEEIRPTSIILKHKTVSNLCFFTFATVLAPLMPICLMYHEHFINTFVDNILKIDSKNTS